MRLKHMVKDKINYRATGKRNFLTRQTNQGRANDGGLKIGEMERDCIMAHGLSYFLNESYMVRGDQYFMGVCNKTGAIAIYNPETNLFLSPFADGPLVFNKNIEGQEVLNAISQFGRSFSIVRIPFALKLLIQELQVMNIQMRIITEDNIDQLLNLSYQSRNIDKLLQIDHGEDGKTERDIKDIVENYKKGLEEISGKQVDKNVITKYQMDEPISPVNIEYTPEEQMEEKSESESPLYAPDSPAYYDYDVNELLENNFTEESQENSTSWEPPFDIPEKNEIFYSLPRYVQDNIMRNVKKEMWWNAVSDANKQIVKNNTGFSVNTPEGSPEMRGGNNVANIFNDPYMNEAFGKLTKNLQSQILQLPYEERGDVMNEIIRKSMSYENEKNDPLKEAFEKLPTYEQVIALQRGYSSMANTFNNLTKKIPDPTVTIIKPETMTEKLTNQFPELVFVEKTGGNTSSDQVTLDIQELSSENTSTSNSNGEIKIIKM
jgi:hypothetical protein